MRKLFIPLGLALLVAVAAVGPVSASSRLQPVTIDIHSTFASPEGAFTATSPVCGSGSTSDNVKIFSKGNRLFFDDLKTFACADGSGTFTLWVLATVNGCEPTDRGIWTVIGGTGLYRQLHGAGIGVGTYFPGDSCSADGINDHFTGVMTR